MNEPGDPPPLKRLLPLRDAFKSSSPFTAGWAGMIGERRHTLSTKMKKNKPKGSIHDC